MLAKDCFYAQKSMPKIYVTKICSTY